jgi:hypothetical protein
VAAESLLRESVDLCVQRNDPYRQGLALLELGRVYQRLAHASNLAQVEWQTRAVATLEEAAEKFESLGAAYDLEMTRVALGLLSGKVAGETRQDWLKLNGHTLSVSQSAYDPVGCVLPGGTLEWQCRPVDQETTA